MHFSQTLPGPGAEVPEDALDRARVWAEAHGWRESASGQGTQPDLGGVFTTLTGEGLPLISLNVSTERSVLTSKTPCSTDGTVLQHNEARPKWTSPKHRERATVEGC